MAQTFQSAKSPFNVDVKFNPVPAVFRRRWNAAARVLADFAKIDLGDRLIKAGAKTIRDRVRGEFGGIKGRLKPYSQSYAEAKGVPRSNVDLTLSGQLLDSITGEAEGDEITWSFQGQHLPASAIMSGLLSDFDGSNAELAAVHHFGSDKADIPARPFFGFTVQEQEFLTTIALGIMQSITVPKMDR